MLLRFGVANHRSIRDYQELFLSASKRIKRAGLTTPVPILQEAALPIVAIYGSNASGKSNLIDAIDEMKQHVVRSHTGLSVTDNIPFFPFLLGSTNDSFTRLDCTILPTNSPANEPNAIYEYGFEYTAKMYCREWLYRITRKERQSTQVLFDRTTEDGDTVIEFGGQLRGENRTIAKLTRANSLFLSAAAQNNHPQLTMLYKYFESNWKSVLGNPIMSDQLLAARLFDYDYIKPLMDLVRQADLGISKIEIAEQEADEKTVEMVQDVLNALSKHLEDSDEAKKVRERAVEEMRQSKRPLFFHASQDIGAQAFDYGMESRGTQVLISLLIRGLEVLAKGALFVVDELDTSLHPQLSRAVVSLFKKEESNPHGAQLIFSTHDVSLLGSGLIQQDEIFIAEKDKNGVSKIVPLTDFKLRSRDNFEKAYRLGRLGGVSPTDEFWMEIAENELPDKS